MLKIGRNQGITLVALVITIIILLILAGITISQLTNSGLFNNTKTAKEEYANAQEKEDDILKQYENAISTGEISDNIIEGFRTDSDESITITGIGKTEEEQNAKLALNNKYTFSNSTMARLVDSNAYLSYNSTDNNYKVLKTGWYHMYCYAYSRKYSTTAAINVNDVVICEAKDWCPDNTAGYFNQFITMYLVKDDIITLVHNAEDNQAVCSYKIRALF